MALAIGRRRLTIAATVVLSGVGICAWIGFTARSAQQHLQVAAAGLPQVRQAWSDGDRAGGSARLKVVARDAASAYGSTHDPVWWMVSKIPVLGTPAATVRGLTRTVRDVTTQTMPKLESMSDVTDPATLLTSPRSVNIDKVASLSREVDDATKLLSRQRAEVAALSPSWFPPVARARQQLLDHLSPVTTQAQTASVALQLIPSMMGSDEPRRYFVAFQNPAELRGTGGLVDAFTIVNVNKGKVTVGRVGANVHLPKLPKVIPGIDPAYRQRYGGQGALTSWANSNLSPDFPEVARAWAAMWTASTGQKITGVIALDPAALAAVMRVTGPVSAPVIGQVDATNVEALVLRAQYKLLPTTKVTTVDRKTLMLGIGTQVMNKLTSGDADGKTLVAQLSAAGKGNHVHIFSTNAEEQALLEQTIVGGQVPRTKGPFAQAVLVNAGGNKLDAYLHEATSYTVTRCGRQSRDVTVSVKLTNKAPRSGLPPYVADWTSGTPSSPGSDLVNLQVLLSQSAQVQSASLDGEVVQLAPTIGTLPRTLAGGRTLILDSSEQAGRPSYGLQFEVPAGASRTLTLHTTEPASTAAPLLPVQTLVNPVTVTSNVRACS